MVILLSVLLWEHNIAFKINMATDTDFCKHSDKMECDLQIKKTQIAEYSEWFKLDALSLLKHCQ